MSAEISLRKLLGLSVPVGISTDFVQKIQARSFRNLAVHRALFNLFFVTVATFIFREVASLWALASWATLSCLFHAYSFRRFSDQSYWTGRPLDHSEIREINLHALFTAIVWGSAFFLLGLSGTISDMLGLWSIILAMMVLSSLIMPTAPMAATIYISTTSLCAAVGFALLGGYYLGLAAIGIGGLMVLACLRSARAQILFEYAQGVLQEKSETVSLLLREFEDSGADWLWQTDTSRCVTHVSPRFAHALGKSAKEVEGLPFLKLVAGDDWENGTYSNALHDLAARLKRRESFSNLVVPVVMEGQRRWWELSASPRLSEDNRFLGFRGVGSDVTEQHESASKISHLARYDTLTALPNRLQLTEALDRAIGDADKWRRRCAFLMIDLDRFKAVNDTLGHLVGDRLLGQVARRLELIMTDNELCGRLGGDEFAVVVKDVPDSNYVATLAKRIIDGLSVPYEVDQNRLFIGASVGSAVGPVDGRTVELLMRSADLALYRSKDRGGNVHNAYQHKLHANAEERRLMEVELRNALENQQLHVEYQPVVDAGADHGILGFEALVRWNNPKFGNVSPAKFIPVAEDARLIVSIGKWVLRRACQDAMLWPDKTRVAVNISVDQLNSPNFIETVVSALHDSGLPAWRLELEVTESIFLRDGGLAVEVLDRVRALGIKLSLDDFGTGYSSLGYLRNVRFDTIKVDRSFVQGAAHNKAESLAIIRAVVALADSLNIKTTAEGVETEAELVMIRQLGCSKIQGYYFGRPMRIADACELFANVDTGIRRNVA